MTYFMVGFMSPSMHLLELACAAFIYFLHSRRSIKLYAMNMKSL